MGIALLGELLVRIYAQVAAAARERADIAEQRLSQRQELAQQRDQHAVDLLQVLQCFLPSSHSISNCTHLLFLTVIDCGA